MSAAPGIDWTDVETWDSNDGAEVGRYAQLRDALLGAADLDQLPDPEPLVENVLQRDSLAWMQGKPGSAKSFGAVDLGACVASGRDWHGHPVYQGVVLYLRRRRRRYSRPRPRLGGRPRRAPGRHQVLAHPGPVPRPRRP